MHSLFKVADDDGKGQGHGQGAADGGEGAHKLAQPGDRENVAVPWNKLDMGVFTNGGESHVSPHSGHGDDDPVECGGDVSEAGVILL